jgi:enoyl-CoA hydratase/carnithine racemase
VNDADCLVVEQRGSVRWLHLNRPQHRNALNPPLVEALSEQVHLAESDPGTHVVAVAGNGPSFCAGGDFRHFLHLDDHNRNPVEFLTTVSQCFTEIATSPVPWVAVLHGHVVAGGLELALACDVVVSADTALIGDGHLNNELMPAAGSSVRLPQAVGRALARWLLLSGELLPASAFVESGWILKAVPEQLLHETAVDVCERLRLRSGPAQRALKLHLAQIECVGETAALREELDAFADNWSHGRPAEKLRTFLQSRAERRVSS